MEHRREVHGESEVKGSIHGKVECLHFGQAALVIMCIVLHHRININMP